MKRSRSPDEQSHESSSVKRSKDDQSITNESYYVIRKSGSASSSSIASKSLPNLTKNSNFNRNSTAIQKSHHHSSHKNHSRYNDSNAKITSRETNFADTNRKSMDFNDTSVSTSSGYLIRKSNSDTFHDEARSIREQITRSSKEQFYDLAKAKNVDFKLEYTIKLSLDGKEIISNSHCLESAESYAYSSALSYLRSEKKTNPDTFIEKDELMIEESNESDELIEQIKQILRSEHNCLLFKTEIIQEYSKKFKKKIPDEWFEKVENNSSFKLDRHGPTNLVSIKLI